MNNCPRCYNSEIGEKDNYCKICGMNLRGEAAAGTTAALVKQVRILERAIEQTKETIPSGGPEIGAALQRADCSQQSLRQQLEG